MQAWPQDVLGQIPDLRDTKYVSLADKILVVIPNSRIVVEEIAREFTLGEFAPAPRPVVRLSADREPSERVEGLLRDMFSYLRPADQPQPLTGTSRERKS